MRFYNKHKNGYYFYLDGNKIGFKRPYSDVSYRLYGVEVDVIPKDMRYYQARALWQYHHYHGIARKTNHPLGIDHNTMVMAYVNYLDGVGQHDLANEWRKGLTA